MEVDLLLLSRDLSPPRADVWSAILAQEGVNLRVHRILGPALPLDANRFETIARARNAGKSQGTAPWVMLLDDDVVLDRHCVALLAEGLATRPMFAALAADCAGEMAGGSKNWDYPQHVRMASVMFRRERLESLRFRWGHDQCDCQYCCDDLRRQGFAIGYLPHAIALHKPSTQGKSPPLKKITHPGASDLNPLATSKLPGRILAAFDRKHYRLFLGRFLATLRETGNDEVVTAVVSGLYPSERQRLASIPNVEVFVSSGADVPARKRLSDFQAVIANWPDDQPVAYWDAGDVVFQASITPLWDIARANPDRYLAVREVATAEQNTIAREWVESIRNPQARARALELYLKSPIINSGFGAGTVKGVKRMLKQTHRLLHSEATLGSTDWGDQTAMNLACHSNPDAWLEIPMEWNYCLCWRPRNAYRVRPDGRVQRLDGGLIRAAHGAGGNLSPWDLIHLTA